MRKIRHVKVEIPQEYLEKAKLYGIDFADHLIDPVLEYEDSITEDNPIFAVSVTMKGHPTTKTGEEFLISAGLRLRAWFKDYIEIVYRPETHGETDKEKFVKQKKFQELARLGWHTTESLREFANNLLALCDVFDKLPMCRTHYDLSGIFWDKPSNKNHF